MKTKWTVRQLTYTALLAAVAGALMSLEFSVPLMPVFYKVDFSDVPAVIALFTMGPQSGLAVEIIKILVKIVTVGTNSNFVGEFANLIGVVLFILPMWLVAKKAGLSGKGVAVTLVISGVIRLAWSCFCNAYITLPLYAASYGISIDDVVRMVSSANPAIQNLNGFIIMATIPFNTLKYALNYAVAGFLYFRLAPMFSKVSGEREPYAVRQEGR